MSPHSKTKHEESFIEPFSPHDKSGEKKTVPNSLTLHDDTLHDKKSGDAFLKNPAPTFSKSFLQPESDADLTASAQDDKEFVDETLSTVPVTLKHTSPPAVRGDWSRALTEDDPLAEIVLLVGAGHLSREVAHLAHYVGFTVDVVDMRKEYIQDDRFPHARSVMHCPNYANLSDVYAIGARHSIVILSHTYETDLLMLSHVVHSEARYIGVAGTVRKQEQLFTELRKTGVPDTELACVSCPIGVSIGAESPQEMALSIVAELIAARTGCLVPHLSRRSGV